MIRRANAQKAKISIFSLSGLNILLAVVSISYLTYRLTSVEKAEYSQWFTNLSMDIYAVLWLGLLLMLMIANWSLEILKWKLLSSKVEYLGPFELIKGVLHGISLSMISPGRSGDFAGRVLSLSKENRWAGIGLNAAGSITQMLVTCLAGGAGFIILWQINHTEFVDQLLMQVLKSVLLYALIAILIILLLIIFLKEKKMGELSQKKLFSDKLRIILNPLKILSMTDYFFLFLYSSLRYAIFIIQFYVLLHALGLPIDIFRAFGILSGVYLLVSVLPISNITDLSLRGSVIIVMYEIYFGNENSLFYEPILVAAASLLWFINLAIPAFGGSVWAMTANMNLKKAL